MNSTDGAVSNHTMNASSNRAIRRRSVSPIYRPVPVPVVPPVTVRTRHPTGGQETNGTAEALVQHQDGQLLGAPIAGSRESMVTTATGSVNESTSMRHSRRDVHGMSVSLMFSEAPAVPINDSPELRQEEDRVRKRLAFHFLNPYEKYKERRMVPWKLIIQFFKVRQHTIIRGGLARAQSSLSCFPGRASDDSASNIWQLPVQPHKILS